MVQVQGLQRVQVAAYAAAHQAARQQVLAELAEAAAAYMATNAPWQDQTGEARAQLHAEAYGPDQPSAVPLPAGAPPEGVVLHGDSDHSIYLETMQAGRFAIVQPTAIAFGGELARRLRGTVAE